MSYSFCADTEIIWDPALRVGKLYLGQARAVAEVLDVPSGLTPLINGTCRVDPEAFGAFVLQFQAWYLKSSHDVFRAMAQGVLTMSVAMLLRTGQQPADAGGAEWDELLAQATEWARTLPT